MEVEQPKFVPQDLHKKICWSLLTDPESRNPYMKSLYDALESFYLFVAFVEARKDTLSDVEIGLSLHEMIVEGEADWIREGHHEDFKQLFESYVAYERQFIVKSGEEN